jgi:hypothetical protein
MGISLTDEDIAIRANVLARFAHRIWSDPQYLPSSSARSPLMALDASYKTEFLECGHLPSKHSDFTTGYGTGIEGKRSCYDCCAKQERAAMIKTGRGTLYLTSAAANGRMCDFLTDWPGKLRFQAFNVTKSHGYGFGRRYDIVCGSFVGPDDYIWSFRNAGDMQLARCKRTKRYGRPHGDDALYHVGIRWNHKIV